MVQKGFDGFYYLRDHNKAEKYLNISSLPGNMLTTNLFRFKHTAHGTS